MILNPLWAAAIVCSFVVCKPARVCVSIRACMEAIHMCNVSPAAVRPCVGGLYPPRGGGQEFSRVLSNDLQSASITHSWDAWVIPRSPGRGEWGKA